MPNTTSCAIGFRSSSNRVEALFQSRLVLKQSGPRIWLRAVAWKSLELMSNPRLTKGISTTGFASIYVGHSYFARKKSLCQWQTESINISLAWMVYQHIFLALFKWCIPQDKTRGGCSQHIIFWAIFHERLTFSWIFFHICLTAEHSED